MKLHWAIMLSNGSITAYWCLETLKKQLRNMQLRNMQLYYNATEFDERACPNPCSSPKAFRGFNSFLSFSAAEVRRTRTRVPTRVRVRIQNRLLSCFISNFFFAFLILLKCESTVMNWIWKMMALVTSLAIEQKSVLFWYRWYVLHWLECRLL